MVREQGGARARGILHRRPGRPGIESIDFRVINIAANGPVVMTERVDVFMLPGRSFELPVMGTIEISDGKIKAWRDYFDINQFTARCDSPRPSESQAAADRQGALAQWMQHPDVWFPVLADAVGHGQRRQPAGEDVLAGRGQQQAGPSLLVGREYWREAARCQSQEVADRGRSVTIGYFAVGEGVLSASPGFPAWLENRLTGLPVLRTIRRPGPGLMWRQHCPLARWIALRQQGDHTSAALSGGGAIP
jgi:Limonene-1,2-epoxide hydrolase catalytic domain